MSKKFKKKSILYLTRNGLMEPLGRSQILPYCISLSRDYQIIIISSEKNKDFNNLKYFTEIKTLCIRNRIKWHPTKFKPRFYKFPPFIQLIRDLVLTNIYIYKYNVDIIHCRSYLSSFIGNIIGLIWNKQVIFDMRGLWPEELALGSIKKDGWIYNILNLMEKFNINKSSKIVSLTESAKIYLMSKYNIQESKIFTIPTCVDIDRFNFVPISNKKNRTFSCIGTVLSDWFLIDWLALFYKEVFSYDENAQFQIVTRDNPNEIYEKLSLSNLLEKKIQIYSSLPETMPHIISAHTVSCMFFKPGISKLGSSPTRAGEILSVGRPVVCNSGVGDMEKIINGGNVGIILNQKQKENFRQGIIKLYKLLEDSNLDKRCRKTAEEIYSLKMGSQNYDLIYKSL